MSRDKIKVVRVTTIEFELSDGRVYQHPIELEKDSAKIYGKRAAENRRKNSHLRVVGGDSK